MKKTDEVKDRSIVLLRSTGGQPSRFLDWLRYINRYSTDTCPNSTR